MHVCDSSPGCFMPWLFYPVGLRSRCHFCEAFCKLGWHLRMPMDGCWEDLSVAGGQARQWGHGSPILFLRGNGSILPCPQLWWGTWCGCPVCISISSLLSWLASLSLKINSSLCCCKEEEVPRGILGVPLAHFPHLGLGSSAPFTVPFPTVAPAQRGGQ